MPAPRSVLLALAASLCTTLAANAPAAQQACEEIEAVVLQCPSREGIAGRPPVCFCEGVLVENLELTCAVNFGCATGDEVGFGEWPACDCRPRDEIVPPGGGPEETGPGPATGPGGVATCEQFFQCPGGSAMEVQSGQCVCVLQVLPQFSE